MSYITIGTTCASSRGVLGKGNVGSGPLWCGLPSPFTVCPQLYFWKLGRMLYFYGVYSIAFMKCRQDNKAYCKTLENYLLPFSADNFGESTSWHFQQDRSSIDWATFTMNWLREKGVSKIWWPAKSPDRIIIENVWGIMARRVYSYHEQFEDIC